jgi:hypothetical protein
MRQANVTCDVTVPSITPLWTIRRRFVSRGGQITGIVGCPLRDAIVKHAHPSKTKGNWLKGRSEAFSFKGRSQIAILATARSRNPTIWPAILKVGWLKQSLPHNLQSRRQCVRPSRRNLIYTVK